MKTYSYENYKQLIDILVAQYGFSVDVLHESITELSADGFPLMRLIYNDNNGMIAISFQVLINGPQSILLFDFIRGQYPKVALADVYYQDSSGETYAGEEASAAYEMDRESEYSAGRDGADAFDKYISEIKDVPVTHISKYAIFEASHPQAKIDFINFLNRKKTDMW